MKQLQIISSRKQYFHFEKILLFQKTKKRNEVEKILFI